MKHSRRAVSLRVVPSRPHTRTHAVMRVMIYTKTFFFFLRKEIFWRPRCLWEHNIKVGLREIRVGESDWTGCSGSTVRTV